jgi:hypothetical protein
LSIIWIFLVSNGNCRPAFEFSGWTFRDSVQHLGFPVRNRSRYYHHWLAALERLVLSKGLTDLSALTTRKEEWADAYRHTPHGKPVELKEIEHRASQSSEVLD